MIQRSNLQTSRLILEPTPRNATLELFIASPTLSEEYALGKLFGLIHVESLDDAAYELAITLRREIQRRYYQGFNLKKDISVEKKFEETLASLNQVIAEWIEGNHISLKLEHIHFILGVIHNHELYFSQIGNTKAYLIHKIKGKDYRPINILESTNGNNVQPSLAKLFSNVIIGEIGPHDALLFCTESLIDYLSLDKLKITITNHAAGEATTHLSSLLKEINPQTSFGALILKYPSITFVDSERQKKIETKIASGNSQRSITDLKNTEDQTEAILAPSLSTSFKHSLSEFFQFIVSKFKKTSPYRRTRKPNQVYSAQTNIYQRLSKEKNRFRNKTHLTSKLYRTFLHTISACLGGIVFIFHIFVSVWKGLSHNLFRIEKKIISTPLDTPPFSRKENIFTYWKEKNFSFTRKRWIITGICILVILFLGSVIWISEKKKNENKNLVFATQMQEIEKNLTQIESILIYGDEKRALEFFLKTEKIFPTLSPRTENQKKIKQLAEEKFSHLQQTVQKIEVVSQTKPFYSLNSLQTNEVFLQSGKIKNDLLLLTNQRILIWNAQTKENTSILWKNDSLPRHLILHGNTIFVMDEKNNIFRLDISSRTWKNLVIPSKLSASPIQAVMPYLDRWYLLLASENQILRMDRGGDNFGKANFWLKEKISSLTNARDMALDGSLYVLLNNNEILRFFGGKFEETLNIEIEPSLKEPLKIVTSNESQFLYILEKSEQRIIVVTKDKKLVKQYHASEWNDLKDMIVAENEKKIYLVNGNDIYQFAITHL